MLDPLLLFVVIIVAYARWMCAFVYIFDSSSPLSHSVTGICFWGETLPRVLEHPVV